MTFTLTQIIIGVLVLSLMMFIIGRSTKRTEESFLSRIFTNNREFDTTVGLICVNVIIFFMLVSFHDDLGQHPGSLGMIFLAAFNLVQTIVLGKAMQSGNGNSNGNSTDNNNTTDNPF